MADPQMPELRLSDAERDQVVAQLNLAMTEGRLDTDEFSERSRQVYGAKVPSDLEGVLEGLPTTPSAPAGRPPAPTGTNNKRWFLSLLGDRVHRGNVDLGDGARSISVLGDTTFDLTTMTTDEVTLQLFSLLGDVTVLVRSDTTVAANIIMLLGDRNEDAGALAVDSVRRVNLRVFSLLGDVTVRVVA